MAALNDESATNLIDDPFDDFGRKAGKSVFVGNHSSFDCSALDLSQKPRTPFPFVVESRADVTVDEVAWVDFLDARDLSFEIVFLFFGRHPGVDCVFRFRGGGLDEAKSMGSDILSES